MTNVSVKSTYVGKLFQQYYNNLSLKKKVEYKALKPFYIQLAREQSKAYDRAIMGILINSKSSK